MLGMYKGVDGLEWRVVREDGQPEVGYTLCLGLFGLAMSSRSAIGPNMPRGLKRCLTTTGVNFRPMTHVVPFMGPIVSVVNLRGRQNLL